jgi:hypothetical protein
MLFTPALIRAPVHASGNVLEFRHLFAAARGSMTMHIGRRDFITFLGAAVTALPITWLAARALQNDQISSSVSQRARDLNLGGP